MSQERPEEGVAQLEFACERKVAGACVTLGRYLWQGWVVKRDERRALALLRRGCALGSEYSCHEAEYLVAGQRRRGH